MTVITSNRKDSIRQLNAYEVSVIAGGWGDDFPGASLLEDEDGNIFSQKNATSLCQIAASAAGGALGGRIVGLIPFGRPALGSIGRMAGNFMGGIWAKSIVPLQLMA